jgi:hypothetical protein
MLIELDIKDLAIIDHLHLVFPGGFTVLTARRAPASRSSSTPSACSWEGAPPLR